MIVDDALSMIIVSIVVRKIIAINYDPSFLSFAKTSIISMIIDPEKKKLRRFPGSKIIDNSRKRYIEKKGPSLFGQSQMSDLIGNGR